MAWTATIKSTRLDGATLWTNVSYTNTIDTEVVDVAHFEPKDKDVVIQNVKNRGKTIEKAWDSAQANKVIIVEVDKEINKPLPVELAITP